MDVLCKLAARKFKSTKLTYSCILLFLWAAESFQVYSVSDAGFCLCKYIFCVYSISKNCLFLEYFTLKEGRQKEKPTYACSLNYLSHCLGEGIVRGTEIQILTVFEGWIPNMQLLAEKMIPRLLKSFQ